MSKSRVSFPEEEGSKPRLEGRTGVDWVKSLGQSRKLQPPMVSLMGTYSVLSNSGHLVSVPDFSLPPFLPPPPVKADSLSRGPLALCKTRRAYGGIVGLDGPISSFQWKARFEGGSLDFRQQRNRAEISTVHWHPTSCSSLLNVYKQTKLLACDARCHRLLTFHVENVPQTLSPHHVQLPLGHSCHLTCSCGDPQLWHDGGSLSYIFQRVVIIEKFLLSREIWPIEFSLKIIFFPLKKENLITLFFSKKKKIGFIWGGRCGASFEVDHAFQNITGSLGPASDYIIDVDLPQINTEPFQNREAWE